MTVWIVSLEWNFPPSEVTGDTGIVGVFTTEAAARKAQDAERLRCERLDDDGLGLTVYEFSIRRGRYCISCGEETEQPGTGVHECAIPNTEHFCDQCAAELTANGSCDNDHDAWDVDVHCTEHEVQDSTT